MPTKRPANTTSVSIEAHKDGKTSRRSDDVATEEPMEVRVVAWDGGSRKTHSIAVTMRTPGNDFELAAGFLFSEGAITERESIETISYCVEGDNAQNYNAVNVCLKRIVPFNPKRFSRHVYTSSSCGVCGKASLEQVRAVAPKALSKPPTLADEFFLKLPETLRKQQAIFERTGGLHASALFNTKGELLLLREDVGRHNALDKLVGALLMKGQLPASDKILLVSGRTSFELVQKAAMAGIPVLAAVGAPSSLAIDLAKEFGMTLVGFLREGRFNIYTASGA